MTAPDPVHDLNEVSRSVLIDVLTVLGKYLDRLVVVGGWVPELSFPGRGHIGTIDVDLAVDAGRIPTTAYDTIRQHLFKAGYRPTDLPSRFEREVRGGAGPLLVRLDLIAGEYAGSAREDSHQQVQEMFVWKARGADLAFLSTVEVEVSGVLPEGGRNRVRVRVPSIAAFLCMKAMALYERKKPKDAYDIYFCVANCAEADTLNDLRSLLDHSLIYEGLRKLRSKFMTVQDVGPVWAVRFYPDDEQELRQRDAFERVTALLEALRIEPWQA